MQNNLINEINRNRSLMGLNLLNELKKISHGMLLFETSIKPKLNIPNFKVFDEISSIAKKNGFEVPKSLTFKTFSTINGREISTVSDALSNLKTIKNLVL